MSRGIRVSEETNDKIRQLRLQDKSWSYIQDELKVSRSTIARALKGKKKKKSSNVKLEVAKKALRAARHSILIDEMPSVHELTIKARAITVMLGIQRMKEIIQEIQDSFDALK